MYQVKSSGYELVGTYECMRCKAATLPFLIFHRGGALFFVIDVMVTVVFEVSLSSCVVVGTFRPAVCCNTLAIQHTGLGSLDVRNPLLEVAAVKSSGQWTKGIRRPRRSENHDEVTPTGAAPSSTRRTLAARLECVKGFTMSSTPGSSRPGRDRQAWTRVLPSANIRFRVANDSA